MNLVISSGHGKYVRGASGYLDEVDEARKVVEQVADELRQRGAVVETFHDDTSTSQNENLNTIVDFHNAQERDLDVSVHFNAYETTSKPMGCEVLYLTQPDLAETVSAAIAEAGSFIDRGPKKRTDLFFLNETEQPAILIETCFVDSAADADLYHEQFDQICRAIAEAISGVEGEQPEPEPPQPEPEPEPPELSGDNRVDIVGAVEGDVTIIINGQRVTGNARCLNLVNLQIEMHGDVIVSINGQDFHNAPSIPTNQCDITATVFGGASDYNTSAYDPDKVLNDTDLYVALPDRIEGERPQVRVYNRITGVSATATIEDVGPWNTDDPYWVTGTRPQAESGTDMDGEETNSAGIDLSPALAKALDIDGMGTVDWEFVR
jgi:N-acetylmuramoyl-L-alanine amidase